MATMFRVRAFAYLLGACLIAFLGPIQTLRADDKVIVHEWGTFTCLQDEQGEAIQGINIDDEPVPQFVYDQGYVKVPAQYSQWKRDFGLPPYQLVVSKGWVPADPQVTMRLETPVIYFYPLKDQTPMSVPSLDVSVDFHDGILSQFYPYAQEKDSYSILGRVNSTVASFGFGKDILYGTTSTLKWNGIRLGSTQKPVDTDAKVWATPREVNASLLEVKAPVYDYKDGAMHEKIETQAEHFLFYRGVGHLDSSLRLQDVDSAIGVWPQTRSDDVVYAHAWLAEIHADGSCFYRDLDPLGGSRSWWKPTPLATFSEKFAASDFSPDNLVKLKASMQDALVKEGLYPDEASAMLRTWELSYFKSPGLRFFYIVPRAWVDKVLPLKITGAPTEITRVMIGRIELISEAQKATLARFAAGPCPDFASVKIAAGNALQSSNLPKDEVDAVYRGEKPLSELGITIPPLVQDYLSLGRFRDALIVHEQQRHPSATLAQFIKDNQLASGN